MEKRICELELKVLYEISRIVGQALHLDQAMEAILRILSDSLAMNRATITLRDEEAGRLVIRASHGLTPAERKRGVYLPTEGVTGLIFRTVQPFVVPDISAEPLFLNKTRARQIAKGRISFLGVPVVLHGNPIGVLSVDRLFGEEVHFEEDIRFLSIVSALIAQFVSLNRQVQSREEHLRRENRSLRAELSDHYQHFLMVGKSRAMQEVQHLIRKVAPSRASVLLLGESGTGKTLIARIIHELSTRGRHPFVKVNCASLPDNLLESELFGYERGAFTGALRPKPGRFEEADQGTVFLDEIGELPVALQAKLLRFLQEREFERLGGAKTIRVDVRILAATNKDLAEATRAGLFREDLYYRLNVFPITVPPLREHPEDIPLLIDYFLGKFGKEYGRQLRIAEQAVAVLMRYRWPGNVRELENLLERLAIVVESPEIGVPDLPPSLQYERAGDPLEGAAEPLSKLAELERQEVVAALERNRWVQSRAARELGLTLRQMGYRIRKFGLVRRSN